MEQQKRQQTQAGSFRSVIFDSQSCVQIGGGQWCVERGGWGSCPVRGGAGGHQSNVSAAGIQLPTHLLELMLEMRIILP